MRKLFLLLSVLLLSCQSSPAQTSQDQINRNIYFKVHGNVSDGLDIPLPALTVRIAESLVGTPYVASTLEVEPESLQIFLDKTDCILFVETCVALSLTFKGLEIVQGQNPIDAEPSYELFCENVRNLRYRDGVIDGYPSRLHYTSEWIQQGERNGIFREITSSIGEPRPQQFNFMSTHPDAYRQLKDNEENQKQIAEAEARLNSKTPYYYVPGDRIAEITDIRDGDIIAFVSNVEGLDITHIGIACKVDDEMHFIHASTNGMEVMVEPRTLSEYAKSGIRVIRFDL